MEMLNQKQKLIVIVLIVIAVGVMLFYYIKSTREVYSYDEPSDNIQTAEEMETKKEEEKIIVHITGAVKTNGIVEVKKNARMNDVIEAAGGITSDADLTNVNLAYIVEDGQKIYIPSEDDKIEENVEEVKEIIQEGPGDEVIEEYTKASGNLININKANLENLKTLPGIGEATALKILEYRETHGSFKSIEDIKNVSGVGDAKFNTIKDYICV